VVDLRKLELVRKNNLNSLKKELHPTALCCADKIIRGLLIDNYGLGHIGSDR